MQVGAASHIGRVRTVNQDLFWHDDRVFIVADGMGGHAAGHVAAKIAVDTVSQWAYPDREGTAEQASKAVYEAIEDANTAICNRAAEERALEGMGTTLTMVFLGINQAVIGHVGDSRAYRFRDGSLAQLTADHSVTAELVRSGDLLEHEASSHPYRHLLTRALGTEDRVNVDIELVDLAAEDGILLCTDGLTAVLTDEDIRRVLTASSDPQTAANRLIAEANQAGGPDNITVVYALHGANRRE